MTTSAGLNVRYFDLCEFVSSYRAMQAFTAGRDNETEDEIWCLEHAPVYTLGLAGKTEHLHSPGRIPVVHTDRGGQVTYHGPGQSVVYLMIDLKRKRLQVKQFVSKIEQSVIDLINQLGYPAHRKNGAPGVYINNCKIAAVGFRIRRGCSYHGLALNVDMDTAPFMDIDPCGYPGLKVTQLSELGMTLTRMQSVEKLLPYLFKHLKYESYNVSMKNETSDFFLDYAVA